MTVKIVIICVTLYAAYGVYNMLASVTNSSELQSAQCQQLLNEIKQNARN